MSYEHTQHGKIHLLLYPVAVLMGAGAWLVREQGGVSIVLVVSAAIMALVAAAFHHLTVRDEGDVLSLRFGPLPLFRVRIAYADIASVERSRSRWIDGFGIHWIPGRGWTYNLWGFDCVLLHTKTGLRRIGTDDPDGLAAFLARRAGDPG